MHEARCRGAQDAALAQALEDQAHMAVLEVPQPAVNQLGRLRARAAGEILLVDERDRQAPHRGVPGHTGADDPAPDDEQVEAPPAQPRQQRVARVHPTTCLCVRTRATASRQPR